MRLFTTLLWLFAPAEAVNVVSMDIAKTPAVGKQILKNSRGLGRRGTILESLGNNVTGGSYQAVVQVGTPPQTMTLAIDTGSSDVWVLSPDAQICESSFESGPGECFWGTFDLNSSSTFDDILPDMFDLSYADNTEAIGDYFTDVFSFGNATVEGLQMGLGKGLTTINMGIMGIGYDTNEASSDIRGGKQYPNLIDNLVSQGLINTAAYSLYLNDLNSSNGSILFGGIDTEKYAGTLKRLPLLSDPTSKTPNITSFVVELTSLTITSADTTLNASASLPYPVVLDSGTTLTYLPNTLAKQIFTTTGATNDIKNSEMILIPCSTNDTTLTYQFGSSSNGPSIAVDITELIFAIPASQWEEIDATPPFEDACMFGIYPGDDGPSLLGDTFLRSAYVVYDLRNNEVALAQTRFGSGGSRVVEIERGAGVIPGVEGGAASSLVATGSSIATATTQSPVLSTTNAVVTATSHTSAFTPTSSITITIPTTPPSSSSSSQVTSPASKSPSSTTGTSSASAIGTSLKSAGSAVPTFNTKASIVLLLSGVFSLIGGIWFVILSEATERKV